MAIERTLFGVQAVPRRYGACITINNSALKRGLISQQRPE
jgi:hypothetical protein